MRGGERVLEALAELHPDADLYTLIHVPGATSERIERLRIRASPLSRIPGAARHYRKLLPLFPWAIERFRLEGYDLVLSISHAVAKGARAGAGATHVCYCLTPMRYVWDQADAYLGRGARRALTWPLAARLRRWDVSRSSPARVQRFLAISETVAGRIRRHYGREAQVIYPPVDVERIRPNHRAPEPFFLLVGGFVPYKREEVAIEAFRRLGLRLVVAGDGPTRARNAAGAPPHVEFTGPLCDAALADLYARCRALIYPQEEDFGLVAVEAQAAGRPVIAFGRGGATETVRPFDAPGNGPATGLWFDAQEPESLAAAVRRFLTVEEHFDPLRIRRHAERFSSERFRREMRATLESCVAAGRPQ